VGIDPLDVPDIPFDGFGGRDLSRPDFFGQGEGVPVKKFPHRLTTNRILDQFPHESRKSSRSIPFKRRKIPAGYHTWMTSGKTPSAKRLKDLSEEKQERPSRRAQKNHRPGRRVPNHQQGESHQRQTEIP